MRKQPILIGAILVLAASWLRPAGAAQAPAKATPFPHMAPLEQYLMARDAEIALAKSAAPPSIADHAEVRVLGRHGYDVAVAGSNGFVCIVERSWTDDSDDPDFWDPKSRGPLCFNPAAARTYLPLTLAKTQAVLAGKSKAEMYAAIAAGLDHKTLPALAPDAMCYMLSKQGNLNASVGRWHPHLMWFVPLDGAGAWGAGLSGSPIIVDKDPPDRLAVMMVVVRNWSDGTPDTDKN